MEDWELSLESVAIGLLSVEVNTIRKCGMSAQKMPEIPLALHSIVECYGDYLGDRGYGLTTQLLEWAKNRVNGDTPEVWHNKLMTWDPDPTHAMDTTDLTNGARTFEALRWAAASALRWKKVVAGPRKDQSFSEEECAVIARIRANCRQLSPVILTLQNKSQAPTQRKAGSNAQPGAPANANQSETMVLLDGTLEQTAQACFNGNLNFRPPLDVAVLVRKVWDIGTEIVLLQTGVQVDGDVVTRISPAIEDSQRDFLLSLHGQSVKTALGQWKALFDLVTTLISTLGKTLFKHKS